MNLQLDTQAYARIHASRPVMEIEQSVLSALGAFRPHSLQEQEAVSLPDRTDSKFLMPMEILPLFLEALVDNHTLLEWGEDRLFTYENTYFDTAELKHYHDHHNGKRNRYKCRYRRYLETDTAYLELKLKSNKLRTVKNRIPWPPVARQDESTLKVENFTMPVLHVNYQRVSLWNRVTNERLTVDFGLKYSTAEGGEWIVLTDVFIAELKRFGKAHGSPFVREARSYGFQPGGFSKYCIGICLTHGSTVKRNRFKSLLGRIGRIEHIGERAA